MTSSESRFAAKSVLAALLPVATCAVQGLCWAYITPYAWFLFYPTIFLSSWLGGFAAGLASTAISTALAWWFFILPVHTLLKPRPVAYFNAAMFLAMGCLFALFHRRLRSARNRADEAERREQNQLLDRMSRLAKVGGWEFDTGTLEGTWTEEVARIHDLDSSIPPTVAMGLGCYMEKDRPAIQEAVRRAMEEGRPYDLELELVSAQGVVKWVRTQGQPVVKDGRVEKVQGAMQDITERKLAELALKESELRFRSLFEQAGVGVVEVDAATGHFRRVNGKFCEILGYTEEELLGMAFPDVTHPDERDANLREVHRIAEGSRLEFTTEKRYVHKDGSLVWGALTARRLQGSGEGPPLMVSVIADITARKRAEAEIQHLNAGLERRVEERTSELKAANQELESFAYAVSHDLRGPLRAMDGFSQALLEDCRDALPPEGKGYLDQIISASRRMGGLIDGLLTLSRATRGDMERVPVDLSALAESPLAEHARVDSSRTASWRVEPGIRAQGDPRMLEAILGNLLGNAWKYTAKVPEPRIEMDLVQEEGRGWIRIADNGCGFDMAYAGKLFKPFQRLHRQDEFPGLGIGLATVQRAVHRHGGQVKAVSAPGEGATFLLNLPLPPTPEMP